MSSKKKSSSRTTPRSSNRSANKTVSPAKQTAAPSPPLATGSVNWTLLGVLAIVAIVAVVGMVRPDKVGVEYEKGRVKGDIERYPLEAHTVPPKH